MGVPNFSKRDLGAGGGLSDFPKTGILSFRFKTSIGGADGGLSIFKNSQHFNAGARGGWWGLKFLNLKRHGW